jgi:hypothetical protein
LRRPGACGSLKVPGSIASAAQHARRLPVPNGLLHCSAAVCWLSQIVARCSRHTLEGTYRISSRRL